MLKTNDIDFGGKVRCISGKYDEAGRREVIEKEAETETRLKQYVVGMKNLETAWMDNFGLLETYVKDYDKLPVANGKSHEKPQEWKVICNGNPWDMDRILSRISSLIPWNSYGIW